MSDARRRDDRERDASETPVDAFDADRADEYDGADGGSGDGSESAGGDGMRDNPMARWLASTAVRWTLLAVGVALLLFALGRLFDAPFLGWIVDAVASETGRWVALAVVALALIAFAANAPWDEWA